MFFGESSGSCLVGLRLTAVLQRSRNMDEEGMERYRGEVENQLALGG